MNDTRTGRLTMRLTSPLPEQLSTPENTAVLRYLAGTSAHSDIAALLCDSVAGIPGVSCYCTDIERYGFCVAARGTRIFAYARGDSAIGIRLQPDDHGAALEAGAGDIPVGGGCWAGFVLFREASVPLHDWMARAVRAIG